MIILSGVLVIIAIALLVAGIVVGETGGEIANLVNGMTVIYMSIAVSIVSFLCLLVGVLLRRKELFGAGVATVGGRSRTRAPRTARHKTERVEPEPAPELTPSPDIPPETTVYVVPGRKRYHIESCRQLAGRGKEELTYVEAREEGFSACTACMPDTALAARAAATEGATARSTGGTEAASDADPGPSAAESPEATITEYGAFGAAPESDRGPGGAFSPSPPSDDDDSLNVRVSYGGDAYERGHTEPAGGAAHSTNAGADAATGQTYVRVLTGTSRYHLPTCALIEDVASDGGDDLQSLTAAAAQAQGYTACLMCRPDREHAHD